MLAIGEHPACAVQEGPPQGISGRVLAQQVRGRTPRTPGPVTPVCPSRLEICSAIARRHRVVDGIPPLRDRTSHEYAPRSARRSASRGWRNRGCRRWCRAARPACIFSDHRSGSRRAARQRVTVRGIGNFGVRTWHRHPDRWVGLQKVGYFNSVAGCLGDNAPESFDELPWAHAKFDEGLVFGDTAERCPDAGESEDVLHFSCLCAELFHMMAFGISSSFGFCSSFAPATVASDI